MKYLKKGLLKKITASCMSMMLVFSLSPITSLADIAEDGNESQSISQSEKSDAADTSSDVNASETDSELDDTELANESDDGVEDDTGKEESFDPEKSIEQNDSDATQEEASSLDLDRAVRSVKVAGAKKSYELLDLPTLQEMIDNAASGDTITISADMALDETVTIPAGKTITLTDDGTARTITSAKEPMFKVEGTLVIDATADDKLTFQGISEGINGQGSIATVTGKLSLKSGTLKGDASKGIREGTVSIVGGTFDMSGGTITGDKRADSGYVSTSTVLIWEDDEGNPSEFNFTGGTISNNMPISGFSLIISGSTVNIDGGSIENNCGGIIATAKSTVNFISGTIKDNGGSGFRMNSGTTLNMSGGTITGNKATGNGGGIYMRDGSTLNMTGGTVSNNESGNAGGGIYASNTDGLNIQAGSITGNKAAGLGGGVYINSSVATSKLDNALVTNNTASLMGGGVWCCPTSEATISVTDGMAIFDNATDGAGDDYANLDQSETEGAVVTLSERMLGGGVNEYYNDGAITYDASGSEFWDKWNVDASVPRYDADNPGEPVNIDGTRISRALKSLPSESAKQSAQKQAKTIISGNSAKAGGGIATNGSFTSGYHEDFWELNVEKSWDAEIEEDQRTAVPVYVVVNDVVLDYIILNQDNEYKGSFNNLPNPESVMSISLLEGTLAEDGTASPTEPTDMWKVSYSSIDIDAENKTMTATVTNSPKPATISVTKIWDDNDNDDLTRPESIQVQLFANGETSGDSVTLDENNSWGYTWDDLPAKVNGTEVTYTVTEIEVPTRYVSSVSGDAQTGFTITNTLEEVPPLGEDREEPDEEDSDDEGDEEDEDSPDTVTTGKDISGTPGTGESDFSGLAAAAILAAIMAAVAHARRRTQND